MKNFLEQKGLAVAAVIARHIQVGPSPEGLRKKLESLVMNRQGEEFPPPEIKDGVRKLLRANGFKPSGRNKPASEYLAQAAREGRFPYINNLVDINNYYSLKTGLPISMLDLRKVTEDFLIRCGEKGEKYIFNQSGQELDLEGLITICQAEPAPGLPLGSPVKDSMAGKISEETKAILAVIYCPREIFNANDVERFAQEFGDMVKEYAEGKEISCFFG